MNTDNQPSQDGSTRRDLLRGAASIAPLAALSESPAAGQPANQGERPNIILIISDQFRWDCIGAMGLNPMNLTPNLDAMAKQGTLFRNAFCNQPVCAPARATMFTSLYPTQHGVWKNGFGLPQDSQTLAKVLREAGYSANLIGKWHLAPNANRIADKKQIGPVAPADRGGFLNLWEASNVLEFTSHPYEGDLFDGDGQPLHFSGQYRTDFMTGLAQKFLRSAKSPFFLTVSYLEVHHQNDIDEFVPPKEYVGRYKDAFVPQDLRPLPGSWPSQLADYYACVAKIDENVGTIRKTLAETGLDKNTIVMFTSDHGCHFKTRNAEYKRSPHESSIHIPLIVEGPGFNRSVEVSELVSQIDFAPTLIDAAGATIPKSMQGRSFRPLAEKKTDNWTNEVYFQMSEFMTARGLRTPQYTYAAAAPKTDGWKAVPKADEYQEYLAYDLFADPFQHVNLAGRKNVAGGKPYKQILEKLRAQLTACMEKNGEQAKITDCPFPYS